jgi:predicted  nucleic acid-binding Zn-ribbon protein
MTDDLAQQVHALQDAMADLKKLVLAHGRELRDLREAVERQRPSVQAIGRRLEDER